MPRVVGWLGISGFKYGVMLGVSFPGCKYGCISGKLSERKCGWIWSCHKTTISKAFCWRGYNSRRYIHSSGFLLQMTDFPNSRPLITRSPPTHPTQQKPLTTWSASADLIHAPKWLGPQKAVGAISKKGGLMLAAEFFHLKPCDVIRNVSHDWRFAHPPNGSLAFLSDSQLH